MPNGQAIFYQKKLEHQRGLRDLPAVHMISSPIRSALCAGALLFSSSAAPALIIYGTGPNDVDNTLNTTAPANGAPWYNVVRFGPNNASGVYLGNGYVLTANHVNLVGALDINGVSYVVDPNFAALQVTEAPDVVDMKLVKILGTPPLPVVQNLPLNFSSTADLNLNCTIIGWGVGKGTVIANKGWNWGGDATRAQRWGTNKTGLAAVSAAYSGYSYEALETSFKRSLGSDTSQITLGDSGGGLFQQFAGVWKLSGITTSLLQYLANAAQYDGLAPIPVGDQPDEANYVRLQKYAHLLRYENWANTKLGSPTASMTADADGDGTCNLHEYAFYTNPNSAASNSRPQVGTESGFVTLTYTQLLSATDLSYVVQESTDLSNPHAWTAATVIEEIVSTSGVTRVVKAKVAINSAPQKFLRLSVTKVP